MRLKNDFTLASLNGEFVAVPLNHTDDFHGIIKLNESGAEVFQGLSRGEDLDTIAGNLMRKYEGLDLKTANQAIQIVLSKLSEAGMIEQ